MLRCTVKFCGGCNPRYERGDAYKAICAALQDTASFSYPEDGVPYDVLLILRGCTGCPYLYEEIEAAHRLRRGFHDAHINQRLRLLNADLQRTLADKDALIAQKDVLMKEVNHRVQNSLQLVAAFLSLQAKSSDDAKVKEHLAEAQARLSAKARRR